MMQEITRFPNLFKEGKGRYEHYYVKSKSGKSYFGERVFKTRDGTTFREVDPNHSKLFASIAKGISQLGLKPEISVLYLGSSHGYTVSFLSDMIPNGEIYALDFAPRVMRDLVFIAEEKKNIAPIFADAFNTDSFKEFITKPVDLVFMDIAQRNQVEIFLKNCDKFLKPHGFGILALKARSVDVTRKPKEVFKEVRRELEKVYPVVDYKELQPFEQDHALFVIKKK